MANGRISADSSARTFLYDISRAWRRLLDATSYVGEGPGRWSEKEEAASEVIISALSYLQRLGCRDIEQLLKDAVERHETHR